MADSNTDQNAGGNNPVDTHYSPPKTETQPKAKGGDRVEKTIGKILSMPKTNETHVKNHEAKDWFIFTIVFMGIGILFISLGGNILDSISQFVITSTDRLNIFTYELISSIFATITTAYIVYLIFIIALPTVSFETKKKFFRTRTSKIYFFLIFALIVANIIATSYYNDEESPIGEAIGAGSESSSQSALNAWDRVQCSWQRTLNTWGWTDINQKCIIRDLVEGGNEADIISESVFTVEENVEQNSVLINSDSLATQEILAKQFKITTTSDLTVMGYECYYKDEKNPFFKEENLDIVVETQGIPETTFLNAVCKNLESKADKLTGNDRQFNQALINIKILMKIRTKINKRIPYINAKDIVVEQGEPIYVTKSKYREDDDFKLLQPNIPLEVSDTRTDATYFPLLIGDGINENITYQLYMKSRGLRSSFGELVSGYIINIEYPNVLYERTPLKSNYFDANDGEWLLVLALSERDDHIITDDKFKSIEEMKIELELNFERESKIQLTVKDVDYGSGLDGENSDLIAIS
jgi:hypothetical protein